MRQDQAASVPPPAVGPTDSLPDAWPAAPIGRVAAPLRDQVLDLVRQGILDFKLQPGQRLVERELMAQLGVSRATVREVVARLASEGLVTIIPQRGAIVSVLGVAEAADIYEMRVALEALAVKHFVNRASDAQVIQLREAFEQLAAVASSGSDNLERLRAKDSFYRVILEGAASPPLTQVLTMLQGRVQLLRRTSLSVPGRADAVVDELRRIVEAVEARDAEKAALACSAHVRNAAAVGLTRMALAGAD